MVLNIKQSLFCSLIKIDAALSELPSVFQQDIIKRATRREGKGKKVLEKLPEMKERELKRKFLFVSV